MPGDSLQVPDLRQMLQVTVRTNDPLEDEAPEHELQVRHLRKVVFQIVQRRQTRRHHSQHGESLSLQVVRKRIQVFHSNFFHFSFRSF
jgi:hypothetical protein